MVTPTILLGLALLQRPSLGNGGPVGDTEVGQTLQMEQQDSVEEVERRQRIQQEADRRLFWIRENAFADAFNKLFALEAKGGWDPKLADKVDKLYHTLLDDPAFTLHKRKKK